MTTNVGSQYIEDLMEYKGSDIQANKERQFKTMVQSELINIFKRPEFINRIDHKIVFNVLNKKVIKEIAQTRLAELNERLKKQGYSLMYDDRLIDYLADMGTDLKNGARPLARLINRQITAVLAKSIIRYQRSNPKNRNIFRIVVDGKSKEELKAAGVNTSIDRRKLVFKAASEK